MNFARFLFIEARGLNRARGESETIEYSGDGGDRTLTEIALQWFLRPFCLPIPTHPLFDFTKFFNEDKDG